MFSEIGILYESANCQLIINSDFDILQSSYKEAQCNNNYTDNWKNKAKSNNLFNINLIAPPVFSELSLYAMQPSHFFESQGTTVPKIISVLVVGCSTFWWVYAASR